MKRTLSFKEVTPTSLEGIGYVLDRSGTRRIINGGRSRKWDTLIPPESFTKATNFGIIETDPWGPEIQYLERHRHTPQFFVPLSPDPYCIVLAGNNPAGPQDQDTAAFTLSQGQGVCLSPGTWHSPIIPLQKTIAFFTAMHVSVPPDIDIEPVTLAIPQKGNL